MAKLADQKIQKSDIEEYLSNYSDFAFEIKVLQKLNSLGFACEHSGTYEDPITKKTREFDIRANKEYDLKDNTTFRFCLAVECKNLRENFPLVIHCMPRVEAEAYQHLVRSHTSSGNPLLFFQYGYRVILDKDNSVYRVGEPVGKSCDQVGKKAQSNELIGSDTDVFDKISQSINSTYDLLHSSHYAGNRDITVFSFVLPILVVPQHRIWTVTYDFQGNIIDGPKTTTHVSYYIDKRWKIGGGSERPEWYYLSHLEIVELEALAALISSHNNGDRFSLKKLYGYIMKQHKKSKG